MVKAENRWGAERAALLGIFQAALAAVSGRRCVRRQLEAQPLAGPVRLLALGKAAPQMALGARDALGDAITAGLVVTREGHGETLPWPCLEGGHPIPTAASLEAGRALLAFVAAAPAGMPFLVLLSGGASACVEALPEPFGLEELQRMNRWLLASGLPIAAVNRVRKSLSLIKGGRLAARLEGRPVRQLLLSDVPGDDPAVIGSGPLVADPGGALPPLPEWLEPWLRRAPPSPAGRCFDLVETVVVARLADALAAATQAAAGTGVSVHCHAEFVAGEAQAAGERLARKLAAGAPGVHLWGGETTVSLPPEPGQGGRCQQMALAAARVLAGREDVVMLAAGSDGSDGPGSAAGALVDGGTVARGVEAGFDPETALAGADAGSFLEASGDLIDTGPTGTNVMDLILGIKRK